VTFSYFIYQFPAFGICFSLSNLIVYAYLAFFWKDMIKKNNEYESEVIVTETHLLELLNNTDKIIHRGETQNEMNKFKDQTNITVDKSITFYKLTNKHTIIAKTIAYTILFLSLWFFTTMM
jgi:ABC-type bacteriocin/lantibiotic exporter with double-glycine peptidase domain